MHVMLEYPAGTVWVGANNGLHRFEGGVERVFTTKDGLPDNSIWGLAAGAGGALWVGTHAGGLSEYRQGRFRTYGQRDGFTPTSILALLSDRDGALWIGTDGGGVSRLAGGKFSSYQTRDGLSNQVIRCLYEDSEGSLWMGTAGGGINRFKEYRVDHAHHAGRASERQRPFHPAGPLRRHLAGHHQRHRPSPGLRRRGGIRPKDGLSRDLMWPVIRDRQNNLWAGFRRWRPAKVSRGTERPAAARVEVSALPSVCCLSSGMARCGPASGDSLIRFQGDSMAVFGKGQGLAAVPVTAMAEGVDGAIWVGTALGVQRLDGGQFGPVLARPGARQMVLEHARRRRRTRVGADGRPVSTASPGRISRPFTPAQGMPETDLGWIVEDDDGYFWIAGRTGCCGFRGRTWMPSPKGASAPSSRRGSARPMGCEVGSEFSFGVTPAAWKGRGNKLYFATYGGMVEIDPARLTVNRRAAAGADRTRNRRPAEAGWRRRVDPRRKQSRIPLHRPHLSLSGVHPIPLQAGRLRCGLGGSRQPARRLLHQRSTRHVPVPRDGAQHGQRLE